LAKITRPWEGLPQQTQEPASGLMPKGMQRIVTFRSSFIFSSQALFPHHWESAKPPWISGWALFLGVKYA